MKTNHKTILLEKLQHFIGTCQVHDSQRNLILIDDIIFPTDELNTLFNILRNSKIPICWIISQEYFDIRLIPFPTQIFSVPQNIDIKKLIKYIAQQRGIEIESNDLKQIVREANGNIFKALNTFQYGENLHYGDSNQKSTQNKTAKIFSHELSSENDTYPSSPFLFDCDYKSLCLCYDCLHQSYGNMDDFAEELEYFSILDSSQFVLQNLNSDSEDENEEYYHDLTFIQEILALSVVVNNSNPKYSSLLTFEEQFKTNQTDLHLDYYRVENDLITMEETEENIESIDDKTKEFLEAMKMLELDPIENCEESTESF